MNKLNVWEVRVPGDFGFNYKLPIWTDQLSLPDVSDLYTFIGNNFEVLKLHEPEDVLPEGYMGWKEYNIFTYGIPSLEKVKEQIINSYVEFTKAYEVETKPELWINGWLNVMEPGRQIYSHKHSMHENSYLSGFINLSENNSTTDMYPPQLDRMPEVGTIKIPNHIGSITLFPQWIYHSVSPVRENLRISLGFDLHTKEAVEFYKNNVSEDMPIKRAIRLL